MSAPSPRPTCAGRRRCLHDHRRGRRLHHPPNRRSARASTAIAPADATALDAPDPTSLVGAVAAAVSKTNAAPAAPVATAARQPDATAITKTDAQAQRDADTAAEREPSPRPTSPPTPAPTPAQTLVQVDSSVTLAGIIATEFNADEDMKAAFAQSVLDSANGFFEEIIDIEAAGRRRLDDGAGVDVSYTGVALH